MKYASVCSGIEAPTVAWHKLGWVPQWFSEIEPFPCRVLAHHYPTVPNLGDMTKLEENETFLSSTIELLVGGTPCQSFSLAGLRGGMADVRGNLALVFCRLLMAKRPKWFVWENVPGVFSSFSNEAEGDHLEGAEPGDERDITETADFATLLTAFRECGYSVAYRVLDSQHFGVPQRRRRVFVVGHIGNDWRPPFAVLFERESMRRDFTPRRTKGQGVAAGIETSPGGGGGQITSCIGGDVAGTLDANYWKGPGSANYGEREVVSFTFDKAQVTNKTHRSTVRPVPINTQMALRGADTSNSNREGVGIGQPGDPAFTLTKAHPHAAQMGSMVRRLTPKECERLQGFPDGYTAIPKSADGPRYKALGNSMTTYVLEWIARRIDRVEKILTA